MCASVCIISDSCRGNIVVASSFLPKKIWEVTQDLQIALCHSMNAG